MIYKLRPILKHRLWGGKTLPQIFNVNTNDTIGEAWILSCINNDNCYISDNKTLKDLFLANKDIVKKGYKGDFPILIKLIDAQKDLSIQVHPSIKTEFWHVLNKQPSQLLLGFKNNVTREQVEQSLNNSTLVELLNHVKVQNGDSYLIKPGTIHAIGTKTFLIEIQQSADVTYRLYDYDRIDSDGKKRPLHIKESLSSIDTNKLNISKHNDKQRLVSTDYFNVYKYEIKTTKELNADENSFNAVTVIEGNATIKTSKQNILLKQYESVFVPANEGKYIIDGKATIIVTTL